MPDNLMLMATEQFIKGVGDYDEVDMAEKAFAESVKNTNIYQIHGHRNMHGASISNNIRHLTRTDSKNIKQRMITSRQ